MVQSNAIQDVLLAAMTPIMTIFCTRLEQHNLAAGLSAAAAYTPADARDIAAYSSVDKSKQQLVWEDQARVQADLAASSSRPCVAAVTYARAA